MQQVRSVATQQRLIDAAVELFIVKGYLETTPREIATAADVTTGAFYYHFASKEELGRKLAEQSWPNVAKVLNEHLSTSRSGLEGMTRAIFAVVTNIFSDRRQLAGFFLDHAVGFLSASARDANRGHLGIFTSQLRAALLDSEIRSGISHEEASDLLRVVAVGALLVSGALSEGCDTAIGRLETAWTSGLCAIVPTEQIPRWERFVSGVAAEFRLPGRVVSPAL